MMKSYIVAVILLGLLAGLTSCGPVQYRRGPKPELGHHLEVDPKESANLSDREYLMRKATLGTRAERVEALDVIERSNDPELFEFLMDRLKKEDDRFIQIRIMQILGNYGDVRAVPVLRTYARWDETRVGCEAIAALYDLGDDSFMPKLILKLRQNEDFPEMAGIAHRTLKRMTGADLPPNPRVWMNYYRSHRLAPYQAKSWFWPFRAPMPPTQPGTTKVIARPKGEVPLPKEDMKIRRTQVTWYEFWRADAP